MEFFLSNMCLPKKVTGPCAKETNLSPENDFRPGVVRMSYF